MKHRSPSRLTAVLLALALILGMCPVSVFAAASDITVSNIALGQSAVVVDDLTTDTLIPITAELNVPADFDGSEPFCFFFQETVPEEQYRGYEPVYAKQNDDGTWYLDASIIVNSYWPQGDYVLSHVTYGDHDDENRVTVNGASQVKLSVSRPNLDNDDPVVTCVRFITNDQEITTLPFTLQREDGGFLEIRIMVTDDNELTDQGNLILHNNDTGEEFESQTTYTVTEVTDLDGNVVSVMKEMVALIDIADLEPGSWRVQHFTVDDVHGNYVFHDYNGTETDADGAANGNDDLLDDLNFTVTSTKERVFFLNTDLLWSMEDGFYFELLDSNGTVLDGSAMQPVTGSTGDICWYAWLDANAWKNRDTAKVYCGCDNTAASWTVPIQLPDGTNMVVLVVNDAPASGEFDAGNDTFDRSAWYMQNDQGGNGPSFSSLVTRVYDVTFNGADDPITVNLTDDPSSFRDIEVRAKLDTAPEFDGMYGFDIGFGPAGSGDYVHGFGIGPDNFSLEDGVWTLNFTFTVDYFAPVGTHALTALMCNGEPVQTIECGNARYTVDRSQVTDNTLPVVSSLYFVDEDGNTLTSTPSIEQDNDNLLRIRIPITDDSQINDEEIVLATDDPSVPPDRQTLHFSVRYNANTQMLEADIPVDRLYAAAWYVNELQISDAYGNATRYHYHDGAALLQNTTFTVADTDGNPYGSALLYFFNTGSGLPGTMTLEVLDENGGSLASCAMAQLGDTPIWHAKVVESLLYNWQPDGSREDKVAFLKVRSTDDQGNEIVTPPIEWNEHEDMVCADIYPDGNIELHWERYDPNRDYSAEEGPGEEMPPEGREVIIFGIGEDDAIHYEQARYPVSTDGAFHLSDEGITLDFNMDSFTFPEHADTLAGTKLAFKGWYVWETDQYITAGDPDFIDNSFQHIHIFPVYEKAPMRLEAGYVDTDGRFQVDSRWYAVDYGTNTADLVDLYDLSRLVHTQDHTFVDWYWYPPELRAAITPNIGVIGFVAEYEKPYVTINYEYINADGDWFMDAETIFVTNYFTELDTEDYMLNKIAPTLTHQTGLNAPIWEYMGWTPSADVIHFGNCYGFSARYPVSLETEKVQEAVNEIENAGAGDSIDVNMVVDTSGDGSSTENAVIPQDILEALAGKDVNAVFHMQTKIEDATFGYSWTVNGQNIPTGTNMSDIHLDVELENDHIPQEVVDQAGVEGDPLRVSISHSGRFGFSASLKLDLDLNEDYHGKYANLYYFFPALRKLMSVASSYVGEDGSIAMDFDHASDYVVYVSEAAPNGVAWADLDGSGEPEEWEIFDSLSAAIEAANENEDETCIALLQHALVEETLCITSPIILDLCDWDVAALPDTSADTILFHITTGSLTVQANTPIEESGENEAIPGSTVMANGELFRVGVKDEVNDTNVSLTLTGGQFVSRKDACLVLYDGHTLLTDGSDLPSTIRSYSENYAAIQGSGVGYGDLTVMNTVLNSASNVAIYWPQAGTLTIYNGNFSGSTALYVKQGTVQIIDGAFYGYQETRADYVPSNNGYFPTGDAIVLDNCGYGELNVTISGGYYYSSDGELIGCYASGEGNEPLTQSDYLAEGCVMNSDGTVGLPRPSATISAKDTLDMNFYVKKADFPEQPSFIVKLDGEVLDASQYTLGDDTVKNRWSVTVGLYANHMCREVSVVAVDSEGNEISQERTLSIRDIAWLLIDLDAPDYRQNRLLLAMLDYGTAAQLAMNAEETELANSYVSDEERAAIMDGFAWPETDAPVDAAEGTFADSRFTANVSALQTVTLNYYIKVADLGENSIKVTLDGEVLEEGVHYTLSPDTASDGAERVKVSIAVNANKMCDIYTVQVVDKDGKAVYAARSMSVRHCIGLSLATMNAANKACAIAMLDYGAMAQIAFDATATDLANRYLER